MPKNPNNHQQPTPEELKAIEDEAIAEAEKIEENGVPEEIDEEEEAEAKREAGADPEPDPEPIEDPEEEELEPEEETPEEPEEQALPSKELYKKKFSESSKENQKIYAKNRVINKALIEAEDVPEPTEEELQGEYRDWDLASDNEKISLKEALISKRWRQTISQAKDQATKIEKWNDGVDEFVDNPKTLTDNPELEGKTEEFSDYAKQEENNSVPFKILVSAFLFNHSKTQPNKGKMFERSAGGAVERPKLKNGMITLEEAKVLRETNYDLWKEKLSQGKIEMNV